jgi:hypothetical protein
LRPAYQPTPKYTRILRTTEMRKVFIASSYRVQLE